MTFTISTQTDDTPDRAAGPVSDSSRDDSREVGFDDGLDHTSVECVVCARQVEMCEVGFDLACPDCLDVFDDADDTCELLRPAA